MLDQLWINVGPASHMGGLTLNTIKLGQQIATTQQLRDNDLLVQYNAINYY